MNADLRHRLDSLVIEILARADHAYLERMTDPTRWAEALAWEVFSFQGVDFDTYDRELLPLFRRRAAELDTLRRRVLDGEDLETGDLHVCDEGSAAAPTPRC